MKLPLFFFVIALTLTVFGQTSQPVELKWKLAKDEKINYLTLMSETDPASSEIDFSGLLNTISESTDSTTVDIKKFVDFLKLFYTADDVQKFVSTLSSKKDGIIDIVIATKQKELAIESDSTNKELIEALKMMQASNQRVVLRGSVYANGGIHSFWVQNIQKNLLAILFELPKKPVTKGDKWQLDISLISNDENFVCDSSSRINEVLLADIKVVNGDTIAVLKYNIVEFVKGNTDLSAFYGNGSGLKETILNYTHIAVAEFSITNGRWISYDGILSIEATGYIPTSKKTKYSLVYQPNSVK